MAFGGLSLPRPSRRRWRTVAASAAAVVLGRGDGAAATSAPSSWNGCVVRDLFLRSLADENGNAQPIDVYRSGDDSHFTALMDFGMRGFELEIGAEPAEGCVARLEGSSALMVDPGSSMTAQVDLQNLLSGATTHSQVKVSRLAGQETTVLVADIRGARLQPAFSSEAREYTAYLDLSRDLVELTYWPLDNGQVISLVAQPQEIIQQPSLPTSSPSSAASSSTAAPRRLSSLTDGPWKEAALQGLPLIGDVQRSPATLVAAIDVGRQRMLELTVTSADGSATGSYRFLVQRPACPTHQRFFDGVTKQCTDVCNEGHFGNHATGRCIRCVQDHCLICYSGDACSQCEDGFSVYGGKCMHSSGPLGKLEGEAEVVEQTVEAYAQKHRMLFYAACVIVLVALMACSVLVCAGRRPVRFFLNARKPRLLESDDDELTSTFRSSHRSYYGE